MFRCTIPLSHSIISVIVGLPHPKEVHKSQHRVTWKVFLPVNCLHRDK